MYMATTYAGCPGGGIIDSCMEALSAYGVGGHHKTIVQIDGGGTGKSAMGALRANVFGSGARTLPASAF